ncbi:MAG: homocysteine biosynthesis protein [Elusimicrobiota bacterium]
MSKTISEINNKIKQGKAVVVTAGEMTDIVKSKGSAAAAEEVDVVTTGTFGPMCSSGVFLNFGHTSPKMKFSKAWLNNIEVHAGMAAVDVYLGATQMPENDPLNRLYPGKFLYGGGHLIEDLIRGKEIEFRAEAYGTDCYPRKNFKTTFNINDLNEAVMLNPRNCYQNYNCAVNLSDKTIYTYMGLLKSNMGNANFCSAGHYSPLLNDPLYRTIGVGTRIFLGGAEGFVISEGTQHSPCGERDEKGIPKTPAGTIMVNGDLKKMSPEWVRGVSMLGYGVSLMVGIGIPVPVIDEDIARTCGAPDEEIYCPVVDYSKDYPLATGRKLGSVSYAELKSGEIEVSGKKVPTASLSSYSGAVKIADILKKSIKKGEFFLGEPQSTLPGPDSGIEFKSFKKK